MKLKALRTWKPWAGLGIAAIALLGAVVSAIFLSRLALRTGVPADLAWTLPVVVDLGGGVATLLWIKGHAAVRGWARGVAVGSLVATLVGNSVSHLIEVGLVPVTVWLVIGVGAVYPAILWLMIHLLALSGSTQHTRARPGRGATEPTGKRVRSASAPVPDRSPAAARPQPNDATGQHRVATEPAAAARPALHAVPAASGDRSPQPHRIDSDQVDVSDLLPAAHKIAARLGDRLSRDALLDALREAGHTVGGRRRAAIYNAVKPATDTTETAAKPGGPAATGA